MSLQLIAKQMEAKGRKGDSMLVHMTPGEVAGLQKLAEAAGGSLSVNPETGLVEANFLKKLISDPLFAPLAGAGLMMIPGVGPVMAAGLVGGGTALATGDVGKGAMAGLGAYGGAGLAGGLMGAGNAAVSQAATAANPAVIGPMPGAASGFEAAKAGVSALGNEAGRSTFMQGVGGVGGLAGKASMAAAPMLMEPNKAPGEAPVDDKMYYTEYNPGQTGQRSNTSSEALQFSGGYSPIEEIKAADYTKRRNRQYFAAEGGLMSLAEGGAVADAAPAGAGGMTGASKAAFDYLMGNAASSAPQGVAGAQPNPQNNMLTASSNQEYIFNPATGTFVRNMNYNAGIAGDVRYSPSTNQYYRSSGGGGSGDGGGYAGPNADFDTPEEQAAFYADPKNSAFAAITRAGQKAFGYTPLGALQDYVDPGFATRQADIALSGVVNPGIVSGGLQDPQQRAEQQANTYDYNQAGGYSPSSGQSYAESVGMGSDMAQDDRDRGDDRDSGGGGGGNPDPGGYAGYDSSRPDFAAGGLMGLAKGGMKSGGFVVPADVVSMIGEGNTDAGYSRIKSMVPGATAIKGKDGGQADTVKTSIEGKQPARVAHGEMYIPPETVKRMGGAKKLYAMMDRVRQQATGSKKQIKPVSLKQAMA